jgi:uncharacterized repeat protein (TIGR01451 family)/gliding motility-associated-like protein
MSIQKKCCLTPNPGTPVSDSQSIFFMESIELEKLASEKMQQHFFNNTYCLRLYVLVCVLVIGVQVSAQFTVHETFSNSSLGTGVVYGGDAHLTSGVEDPVGQGWLRLTPATINKGGYSYVNNPTLPSNLGVLLEFEYKAWRNTNSPYWMYGADGISVFLFDATVPFSPGANGGGLSYATRCTDPNNSAGMNGGYIALGLDEYGNFSNVGSIDNGSLRPNSVTFRGLSNGLHGVDECASGTITSNPILQTVQLGGPSNATVQADIDKSIDYDVLTTTRPTDNSFYRKVKVSIVPVTVAGNRAYHISAYWKIRNTGPYVFLTDFTTTNPLPDNLKIGFGASTGNGFDNHDVRALNVTTPGNVRLTKTVDKTATTVGNQLTYRVDIYNEDANQPVINMPFTDQLSDGNGDLVTLGSSTFSVTSIIYNNNGYAGNTASGFTSGVAKTSGFTNPFNATLNMNPGSSCTFFVTGTVNSIPALSQLNNDASIDPVSAGIEDTDLTNNEQSVTTTVLASNTDFLINQSVDQTCPNQANGNTYTLDVENVGKTSSVAGQTVTVTDTIPDGFGVTGVSGAGWTITNSGNIYRFTRTDALAASVSYPSIVIQVTPPITGGPWTNSAYVRYTGTDVTAGNNSSSTELSALPAVPVITVNPPTCSITGTASVSNYDASETYTFNPSGPLVGNTGAINGLTPKTSYSVTATNAKGCSSPSSSAFSVDTVLATPDVPLVTVVAPTCSTAGSASVSNYDSSVSYGFNPAGPSVGSDGSIGSLTFGVNYLLTATNANGCSSVSSSSFSVDTMYAAPDIPVASVTKQPTCIANGEITVTSPVGSDYSYSIDGVAYQSETVFSGLMPGDYTATVKNLNGCINVSVPLTVNVIPDNPVPPSTTDVTYCVNDAAVALSVAPVSGLTAQWYASSTGGTAETAAPVPSTNLPGVTSYYVSYKNDVTGCESSRAIINVTVNPLPSATIAGTASVCANSVPLPEVTFTGSGSTAPYTFTYTDPQGLTQTVVSDPAGVAKVQQSTVSGGVYSYNLISVHDAGSTACVQAQAGTATITVNPLPAANITGTTSVCQNSAPSPDVTFTGSGGTAPYTFTYTDPSGTTQTVVSDLNGKAEVSQPTAVAGTYTYNLVSVQDAGSVTCSKNQTDSATITVNALPAATIAGSASVCLNSLPLPDVTFAGSGGRAPYTFTYTDPLGTTQTVVSDPTGVARVAQSTATTGIYLYTLVSVQDAGGTPCGNVQNGSAAITILSCIEPRTESGTVTTMGGTAIPNVLTNDVTNGVTSDLINSAISESNAWPAGIHLDTSTGAVTVDRGTAAGRYAVEYTLCDKLTPQTCKLMTDTVTVIPASDLSVSKTIDNQKPKAGDNVIFTITATNNGPDTATGVVVADTLPTGYRFVSSNPAAGTSYDNATGLWIIGNLADKASVTLTVTATVLATGKYTNTASVSGNESDPDSNNNIATSTPTISLQTDLSIRKTVDDMNPKMGNNVTFSVIVTNNGPNDATGVIVNESLTNGYTYSSYTASAGQYDVNKGLWSVGNLKNGRSDTLKIVAKVNASVTNGCVACKCSYANTASVTGDQTDPSPDNNTSVCTPIPVPQSDLSVRKTVSNANPNVGNNITFTITVSNNGPSDATGVIVKDTLPSGYGYVSNSVTVGSYDNNTGQWLIGNLSNGSTVSMQIVAKVLQKGEYTNRVSVLANEADPRTVNNADSITPVPVALSDLSLVKTIDNQTPGVGDNVTFTITVRNNGPSDNSNVKVTELLASGYTYESHSVSAGSYDSNTGIWQIGSLATGDVAVMSITAKVNPAGHYGNSATVSGDVRDPNLINNTSVVSPQIGQSADLSVLKAVNHQTPAVGDTVSFTVKVINNGPGNATGVAVNDLLPDGYRYIDAVTLTGNYNPDNGVWGIGALPVADTAYLHINARVLSGGNYANTAVVKGNETDPVSDNNIAVSKPSPVSQCDLALTKTVDKPTPDVGDNVTFNITVVNNGPSDATGVMVTDSLPDGYEYVSYITTLGSYNSKAGEWLVGNLRKGSVASLQIVAKVLTAGHYLNKATVTGNENDSQAGNNTATATIAPVPLCDLSVSKTTDNQTPNIGSNITFNIRVKNNGPSDATGVNASDVLPSGYSFVSSNTTTGSFDNTSGQWQIGKLANDSTASLRIIARVLPVGLYSNTATVSGSENDPVLSNNRSVVTPVPALQSDLAVVKSIDKITPFVGDTVAFVVRVANNGPNDATGVVVKDVLPDGYSYVSSAGSAGNYNVAGGQWQIGALANGSRDSVKIAVRVLPSGSYSNTATVSGDQIDPVSSNNASIASSVPVPRCDLAVSKSVDNTRPQVGSNITFTVIVVNNGPSDATGVKVSDVLPGGYQYVSNQVNKGGYDVGAGVWSVGKLANGAVASMQLVAKILPTGLYTNTASVQGNETDPVPDNNTSSSTPAPVPQCDLSVLKTADNQTPAVNDNVTFTITAKNNGPSDASGVKVSDILPTGCLYVSSTATTGGYDNTTGLWQIGNLPGNSAVSLRIVTKIQPGGTYTNTAGISGNEADPIPANNTATCILLPVSQSDLSIVKTVDRQTPDVGDTIAFTLSVVNNGPGNATDVSVSDILPAGYQYVDGTAQTGSYNATSGLWTIGNLANGSASSLLMRVLVKAKGAYGNVATVRGKEPDPVSANNIATCTPMPVDVSDLKVIKTVNSQTPAVGDNVTFNIEVQNNGPSDASGVIVNDLLPSGYKNVSYHATKGSYDKDAGKWEIGNLSNGSVVSLQITAKVLPSGSYANVAIVKGNQNDPDLSDNTSVSTPMPIPQCDLSVVKTVGNPTPNVNGNVTFAVAVKNNGPGDATGVRVNDALPTGYSYVSSLLSAGSYDNVSGQWQIGTLSVGATVTLNVTARVLPDGSYTNTATVSGNESDPVLANNSSAVTPVPVPQCDLSVVKTVDQLQPKVGTTVTFTILVTNHGPGNATGVKMSDMLLSGYRYEGSTANTGTYNPVASQWIIGDMPNGATDTLHIQASVLPGGTYVNTATVEGSEKDPSPANNVSVCTPVPIPQCDLNIKKIVDKQTPNVGDNVTFTITAANDGPSDATGVQIAELLPSGYSYLSDRANSGSYDSSSGSWLIGNLPVGTVASLQIVGKVLPQGQYANTATIAGAQSDPVTTNNAATCTPVPVPQCDLSVVKTVGNPTPNVNGNVTFAVAVKNNGPGDATGVRVNDALPTGYSYVSSLSSAGSYDNVSGQWQIGTLSVGATVTLNVTARVLPDGSYTNTATVSGNEPDPVLVNNSSAVTPVPVPQCDLSVVKTVDQLQPKVGTTVTFTILVTNHGPGNATGVKMSDMLLSGYRYEGSTANTGTYNPVASQWIIGDMPNGATDTLHIQASVLPGGTYVNTATVEGSEKDPSTENNVSVCTPVPVSQCDLSVFKSVNNSTPKVGDVVTFTIMAANNGPSDATGVKVNDPLPSGYSYVSNSPTAGAYNNVTGVWSIGNLGNGSVASLQITARVLSGGSYANTASISGDQSDPVADNSTSTITPVPVLQTDLSVIKTVNNTTPKAGDEIIFTITATNHGPSDATGVKISELLPDGYSYISSTTGTGSYLKETGVWNIGNLLNGSSVNMQIAVKVLAAGNYANVAIITGNETDSFQDNNSATSTPVLAQQSDLSIVKTATNANPKVGDQIDFTVTVTNKGPSNATGVDVTDLLPSGYYYIGSTTNAGIYDYSTGNWTIGSLDNGKSVSMQVTVKVQPNGIYTNTASVKGNFQDPDPTNNISSFTPHVNSVPVAVDDYVSTNEMSSFAGNLASNDTPSPDGGNVWAKLSEPIHGMATVNSDGTFIYTPTANYHGADSFTYRVCDVDGDCATATVYINIMWINHLPVAVNDTYTIDENTELTVNLAANDTPSPDGGNVWSKITDPKHGEAVVRTDGTLVYIPDKGYSGKVTFTYTITDMNGDQSNALVEILVKALLLPPVAVNDINDTRVNQPVSGQVLTNDYDPDGGTLTVNRQPVIAPANGTVMLQADGNYSYTPYEDYTGIDNFTYSVCNSKGLCSDAVVSIQIIGNTDQLVANNDNYHGKKNKMVAGNLIANDYATGNDVFSISGKPVAEPGHGTVTIHNDGTFTYQPANEFTGEDNFTYQISIPSGQTATAIATLLIEDIPDTTNTTVATDDSYITFSGMALRGNVAANDYDPENDKQVLHTLMVQPRHGNLILRQDGSFVYTPAQGYTGPDNFVYTTCDNGARQACDQATAYIVVLPVRPDDAIDVIKTSSIPRLNFSGTYSWRYTVSLKNKLSEPVSQLTLTDDLRKVFVDGEKFTVNKVTASGNLLADVSFDGDDHRNLLLPGSYLLSTSQDSVSIDLTVDPEGYVGNVYNQAQFGGYSASTGSVSGILSDDPANTIKNEVKPRRTVTFIPEIQLIIPTGFSPNGDLIDDKFEIVHSSELSIDLKIFNRWGNQVYESNNYQNDWDGIGSGGFLGKKLPDGTYYCVIVVTNKITHEVNKLAQHLTLKR